MSDEQKDNGSQPLEPASRPRFIYHASYVEVQPNSNMFSRNIDIPKEIQELLEITDKFVKEHPNANKTTEPFFTSAGLWELIRVGEKRESEGNEYAVFRGYIMVEPEQLGLAVGRVLSLAEERDRLGLHTEFKWLVGKNNIGSYTPLNDDDDRIVLYADTREEILEVLQELVDKGWDDIEKHRLSLFGGNVEKTPRINGSDEFRDREGNYWRSLNFNSKAGPSEDNIGQGEGRPVLSRKVVRLEFRMR